MTSSGTYAFSLSYGEALLAAYARTRARLPELRQEHFVNARRELNLLLSAWSNKQVNLWKVELISQALTQGTATYNVDPSVVMILDSYRTVNNATAQQTDNYMSAISRTTYATYANKFTQGPPTTYWFDRLISPTVTLWPVPDGAGPYTFNYYAVRQVQDADIASGETPDVPYRWLDALVAGLAYRLGVIYAEATMLPLLKEQAALAWSDAAEQDTENVNVKVNAQLGQYYT
jgi:hypothetical protein